MSAQAQLDLDLPTGPTARYHPDRSPINNTRFVRQEVASHTGQVGFSISLWDDDREGLANKFPATPPEQSLGGEVRVKDAATLIGHDNGMG
jgi:hypothetical protein